MFKCLSQKTDIALYADDTKILSEIKISKDHFILQKYKAILINFLHGQIEIKFNFIPLKVKYCPSLISEIYSITYHLQYFSID